jgi:signal peptidase I
MAPTLRGAHIRMHAPPSGYDWSVDPQFKVPGTNDPYPVQGLRGRDRLGVLVHDPMSGVELQKFDVPTSWGDRIFVLKYLYSVYEPQRYDVVVFKNPNDPGINYIKRLIGLPGEMIALIDGDVFTRRIQPGDTDARNTWLLPGWSVARKPERAQRAMWQPVFDSEYQPLTDSANGRKFFHVPWRGAGPTAAQWSIEGRKSYTFAGTGPASLEWDSARRPINDSYAYNENPGVSPDMLSYPVSDVRVCFGVRPEAPGLKVAAVLHSRRHEFRAEIDGAAVTLRMKPDGNDQWRTIGQGALPAPLAPGAVANLDVWFVDQTIQLFLDDRLIARGEYDWSPDERLRATLGFGAEEAQLDNRSLLGLNAVQVRQGLPHKYPTPRVHVDFDGGGFTLHRVSLARDIYYQPRLYYNSNDRGLPHSRAGQPAAGTNPQQPINLSPEQLFVCGDNSPASLDARLWDKPNPWVAQLDPTIGVVHRDLLIGKAFFVYFPSPHKDRSVWAPDFGDMRFIW